MNDELKKLAEDAAKIEELDGTLVLEILQTMASGEKLESIGPDIDINDPDIVTKTTLYEDAVIFLGNKYVDRYNKIGMALSGPPERETEAEMVYLEEKADILNRMLFASIRLRLLEEIKKLKQPVELSTYANNIVTAKHEDHPSIPAVQVISGGSSILDGLAEALAGMTLSAGEKNFRA